MLGFKNVNVYVEGKGIIKTSIGVENGKIVAIGDNLDLEEYAKLPNDALVAPGFIDQHIHGAMGSDAMDGTIKDLENIAVGLAKEGTTAFLATTMTQSVENICKALKNVDDYMKLNKEEGAKVLGVHLEGPFISPLHVGAQPIEYVQAPSIENFKVYEKASGNHIKEVTLAPEIEGALDLIKYLKEKHIVASIGHTAAGFSDCEKAVLAGASNVTHTYNAQKALHHREVGTVGSAMLFDELNCELICDTIHVSVPAIKLVIKNKPADKVTLITDAMRAKGMPDGDYELGGQPVIVKNKEARLENGTLAGSVLLMKDAIKNVHQKCGIELTKVIDMATINPAKNLGLDRERGSIKVGKVADFAVINKEFEVLLTIRDGKIIYKK